MKQAHDWHLFYIERGFDFGVGDKIENVGAMLAYMSGKTAGKSAKIDDFLPPHRKQKTKPKKLDDAAALAMFQNAVRMKNG